MRYFVIAFSVACSVAAVSSKAALAGGPYDFYELTPCRVWDTRDGTGFPSRTTPLASGTTVNVTIRGRCGLPVGAKVVALNVTVVSPNNMGHLTLYPAGTPLPTTSSLNYNAGEPAIANGAIVPLASVTPDLAVSPFLLNNGTTHVLLDITGYYR